MLKIFCLNKWVNALFISVQTSWSVFDPDWYLIRDYSGLWESLTKVRRSAPISLTWGHEKSRDYNYRVYFPFVAEIAISELPGKVCG